jgi:hypothetical protein
MATIVTRTGKGSPLTYTEMDDNFTNLNNSKLEVTSGAILDPVYFTKKFGLSGVVILTPTGATYTIGNDEFAMVFQNACQVILPSKTQNPNRMLLFKNSGPNALTIATGEPVIPLDGGAPTYDILPAVAGKFALVHLIASNWRIIMAN